MRKSNQIVVAFSVQEGISVAYLEMVSSVKNSGSAIYGGIIVEAIVIIGVTIGSIFMPLLGIIFCVNLVTILKKIKNDEETRANTFWLTFSFTLIVWSLAMIGLGGVY